MEAKFGFPEEHGKQVKSHWGNMHPTFADMGQVGKSVSWVAKCMEVLSLEGGARGMGAPTETPMQGIGFDESNWTQSALCSTLVRHAVLDNAQFEVGEETQQLGVGV